MIYLATPYSHPKSSVRNTRYMMAMKLVHFLCKTSESEMVYSPIVHWHPIARRYDLPKEHNFWSNLDEQMIDKADKVYFVIMTGWETSEGMKQEYHYALVQGKQIYRVELRHDALLIVKQIGPLYE
jgi:hypothetical protein